MSDFSDTEISSIFCKWDKLYIEQGDALNSYFENHINIYTPPSTKIKSFISTIDTLSKEMRGPKGSPDLGTKKAKYLLKIIEKYNINSSDANELKTRFLNVSGVELKTRFTNLIKVIDKYLSNEMEANFVIKAVNTRHNIIHPNANMQPSFSPVDYEKVATQLNKIILTYILVILGMSDSIIDRVLKTSGCANTLS